MDQTEFNIHDFIENYEDYMDPDIQWKTTSRKEFLELQGDKREKPPELGKFFKHQDLFFRYARIHDRILNIHETGTGKTGSFVNLTEFFRKKYPNKVKRVYVLQPGPATVDDFKDQLIKLSTSDDFKKLEDIEDEKTYKNNMTRLISRNYEITTYQKFIKDDISIDEINDYYDDCIFFLDEAHKLRNLSDSSGSKLTEEQIDKIYNYIWKVLHTANRTKIIVATATPMINKIDDFVPLVNLLLPSDRQFPKVRETSFYENLSLSQVEPFFRGMISYVRFLDTGIKICNRGVKLENIKHSIGYADKKEDRLLKPVKKEIKRKNVVYLDGTEKYELAKNQPKNKVVVKKIPSQVLIYPVVMKGKQLQVATEVQNSKEVDSFLRNARQSSVFVFPNGEYGKKGFDKYVKKDEYDNYVFKNYVPGADEGSNFSLTRYISKDNISSSLKNLSTMSAKFTEYIKREIEQSEKERPGNSFCYLELVEGSGVVLLSLILEKLGFENFKSNDLSILDVKNDKIRESFPKKKRFALLTGKTGNIRNTLKIFNHPDNIDGKYIQMIIASEVARDGINLHNVLRGYILSPGWHESGMYQALSRFVRATSHEDLKNRELLEAEKKGKTLTSSNVKIDIYRMASVRPNENLDILEGASTDIKIYIDAEKKDINNKKIIRFMKQCAFDAYLNYKRNIRESDQPFTKQTDYQDKYMEIWKARGKPNNTRREGLALNQGPNKSDYVYNTYNILEYSKNREVVINILKSFLIQGNSINFEDLYKLSREKIKDIEIYTVYDTVINYASRKLIFENLQRSSFLTVKIIGNYIKPEPVLIESNPQNRLKNEMFKVFNFENIEEVEFDNEDIVNELYQKFKNFSENDIINYYIYQQNYVEFKYLLEDVLIRKSKGEKNNVINNISKLFDNYYLETYKPENWFEETRKAIKGTGEKKQGRTRAEGSLAGLKNFDLGKYKEGFTREKVIVHFYRESDKTGFSITSILEGKVRRIRILEGDSFRDADPVEQFVYTYMFDQYYNKLLEKYKKSKYYGSYIYRGGEQIESVIKRKREFFRIIDTSNPRNKGIVCVSISSEKIQGILKSVDTEKKYKKYYTGSVKKEEVCEIIMDIFRKKGLLFVSL